MKHIIDIQLCKNHLTNDDSYYAQIFKGGMRTKEEIIEMIIKDRTELRKETISTASSLYDKKVMERLLRGEIINYGFFQLSLSVSGKFKLSDRWNPEIHHFELKVEPSGEFRSQLQETKGEIVRKSNTNIHIYSMLDTYTQSLNKYITPGRPIEIRGKTIKIEGENPDVGVYLQNIDTEEEVKVPQHSILINYPTRLLINCPETLEQGSYHIIIRTQHTVGHKLTKELKVCQSTFTVGTPPLEG